jgi:hypothetical protein
VQEFFKLIKGCVKACGGAEEDVSEQAAVRMYVEAVKQTHAIREREEEMGEEAGEGGEAGEEEKEAKEGGTEDEGSAEEGGTDGGTEDEIHEEAFCQVLINAVHSLSILT